MIILFLAFVEGIVQLLLKKQLTSSKQNECTRILSLTLVLEPELESTFFTDVCFFSVCETTSLFFFSIHLRFNFVFHNKKVSLLLYAALQKKKVLLFDKKWISKSKAAQVRQLFKTGNLTSGGNVDFESNVFHICSFFLSLNSISRHVFPFFSFDFPFHFLPFFYIHAIHILSSSEFFFPFLSFHFLSFLSVFFHSISSLSFPSIFLPLPFDCF